MPAFVRDSSSKSAPMRVGSILSIVRISGTSTTILPAKSARLLLGCILRRKGADQAPLYFLPIVLINKRVLGREVASLAERLGVHPAG